MPSAKGPQCPWPGRKQQIPAEAKQGYNPKAPPETSRLPATPPAPSLRPGSSEGCSDSAESPKETERVPFSLGESASPNTCAFPPPPWLARSRTGTKGPVARHPPNRKFHLSGQLPGHRGQWSGPRAETKRGRCGPSSCRRARAPRPRTAPAKPAALAPARGVPAPRRPRPAPTSGRELYLSPALRSLEPPPPLRPRSLFMVPVAARGSQRRGPRGRLAPIAAKSGGSRGARGAGGEGWRAQAAGSPIAGPAPGQQRCAGRVWPGSSCPAQVVSGCGLPGRPAPRRSRRHLSRTRLPPASGTASLR